MDEAFDAALAELGDALAPLYEQRATITRPGRASDGMGGSIDLPITVAANVPCMVQASGFTREEHIVGAQITASKLWAISMPLAATAGWQLLPQDTITVGSARYEVSNATSGEAHAVELVATCVRLDPQPNRTPRTLLTELGDLLVTETGDRLVLETA
jgi:hypothetical protein